MISGMLEHMLKFTTDGSLASIVDSSGSTVVVAEFDDDEVALLDRVNDSGEP